MTETFFEICYALQNQQEFVVNNTTKYAQLILNFCWVV